MRTTSPNRNSVQASGRFEQRRKQSGDQHVLPEDESQEESQQESQQLSQEEPQEEPHRPQRISREDMQKMRPADPDPDDPTSP